MYQLETRFARINVLTISTRSFKFSLIVILGTRIGYNTSYAAYLVYGYHQVVGE